MLVTTRAWLAQARLRRRIARRRTAFPPDDALRRDWIARHVPGRSFADVGGLHRLGGDMALYAEQCGATATTVFDGGDAYLTDFFQKVEAQGAATRFLQGDLEEPVSVERLGVHDIVYCVGVVYHTPHPLRQLEHLRQVTGELLYLGSHTIPEVPGLENVCVFYPYVSPASRAEYAKAHEQPEGMWGIGTPFDETPWHGHGNFWWGMTPSALRAMLRSVGFEVIGEQRGSSSPFFTELIARPTDAEPLMPPERFYREWGEARARGEEPPPFGPS